MIGKKVKARREQLGLTQEELAKKLGYKSKSTINKIELDINDVSQSKLVRLAAALEVDPGYFIEIEPANDHTELITEYVELFSGLSDENKKQAIQYMTFLSKQEEGKQ